MAHLNGKGPENQGSGTGRKLGKCCKNNELRPTNFVVGQGMGKRRKPGKTETSTKN